MKFTITPDHLKLIQRMYWETHSEVPEVNYKRPFGNSDIPTDICEILERPVSTEECYRLERELCTVMQIATVTLAFELGTYTQTCQYDTRSWIKERIHHD